MRFVFQAVLIDILDVPSEEAIDVSWLYVYSTAICRTYLTVAIYS